MGIVDVEMGHLEAISKMPNGPISASGLNHNPRNIIIYSSGYNSTPSLTSNHFPIFEIASNNQAGLFRAEGHSWFLLNAYLVNLKMANIFSTFSYLLQSLG